MPERKCIGRNGRGIAAVVRIAMAVFFAAAFLPAQEVQGGQEGARREYTPGQIEGLLSGKGKKDVTAILGAPDGMYGVMGDPDVAVNVSAHWVYRPPKSGVVVEPATGTSPSEIHFWFDPNDRVERVTFQFGVTPPPSSR